MPNPFALLGEDDDVQELAINNTNVAPGKAPVAAAPVVGQQAKGGASSKDTTTRSAPAARGRSEYGQRNANRRVYQGDGGAGPEGEPVKDTRGARGHGKSQASGQGRPRGGRGGRGSGGNRQFDRHSMTGKVDSDKQVEQGWGIGDSGKRELADEVNGEADAKADASGVATPVNAEAPQLANNDASAEEAQAATPSKTAEPEDNTLTYEQYLAQQRENAAGGLAERLGLTNKIRQANEGADDAQWKDAVQHNKGQEDEDFFVGESKDKTRKRAQKEGKTYIEIDARFPRPASDRGSGRGGFRGGRGGGGERGSRGGFRGSRGGNASGRGRGGNTAQPVDTNDVNAFPSLS